MIQVNKSDGKISQNNGKLRKDLKRFQIFHLMAKWMPKDWDCSLILEGYLEKLLQVHNV